MNQRNPFSQVHDLYAHTKGKAKHYAEKHPDKVIAAMFFILLVAVTIFLISKATHKQNYQRSAATIMQRITPPISAPGKPITADIMDLLILYGKTRAINPGSLTLKDSVLLKEIDRDLKNILDEKD